MTKRVNSMPIYEYQCDQCKQVHEVIQKFSDAPLTECPGKGVGNSCGGKLTKLMSMNSFALQGSGWYTTDYKRKGSSSGGDSKS
ncbi:MAG: FmdB family zinc ribbon protein [Oligoflexia bacterium]